MSTMRNGLNTWLKQECVDIADKLYELSDYSLDFGKVSDPQLQQSLRDAFSRTISSLPGDLREEITRVSITDQLGLAKVLHKLSFEKLVECQCGKQTTNDIHTGDRVRFKTTGDTGTVIAGGVIESKPGLAIVKMDKGGPDKGAVKTDQLEKIDG